MKKGPDFKHLYGPVPSRRLGRSLGIDLVPLKVCSYDCVYCQLGRTTEKTAARRAYVPAELILAEVQQGLEREGSPPDYIGIAGSGEPTLNSEIGRVIQGIKKITTVPIALLTNGSLLWMTEVQDDLMAADVVLPSLDAGDARMFKRVNRPHRSISFERMVEGLVSFTKRFPGKVWLEVLLLAGMTGTPAEARKIAALAKRIAPARIQLNTVCRPPAEQYALSLSLDDMQALSALFAGHVDIISHAREEQAPRPQPYESHRADILALLRRRPCTARDIAEGLDMHVNEVVKELDALAKAGSVATSVVDGQVYHAAAP